MNPKFKMEWQTFYFAATVAVSVSIAASLARGNDLATAMRGALTAVGLIFMATFGASLFIYTCALWREERRKKNDLRG